MNTIKNTEKLTISIDKRDLFEGEWLNLQLLSQKIHDVEKENNMAYKALRNRLYNSRYCNKYNLRDIAGIICINVKEPMASSQASLILNFEIK